MRLAAVPPLLALLTACTAPQPQSERPETPASRVMVLRCDDGLGFVAELGPGSAWLFLPGGTVELARVANGREQRFEGAGHRFQAQGEEARLWTPDHRDHGTCRNDRRRVPWERAKLDGVDFRAVGNEPGWSLEIREGASILLVTDYGARRGLFSDPRLETDPATRRSRFTARRDGERLEVILEPGPCADTMADETYETRVTVILDGRTLRGCGQALH